MAVVSRRSGGHHTGTEDRVKLGRPPIMVPITKGTGIFKGVTGMLSVGAESRPINTYQLKFP